MRHTIGGLAALLLGAGLLLLGHGMLTTLLAVRGEIEGFGALVIGAVGTTYYLGFFSGCVLLPPLMRRVGHIRMFSAAGALVAAAALAQGLLPVPEVWLPVRYVTGFAMATMFMAVESWLNVRATNATRGRIYSIYMLVNLGAAMLAQQGLRLAPPADVTLFAIAALLICLGLLPVTLTRSEQPPLPPKTRLDLWKLLRLSPMGAVGCFLSGMITSPFWAMAPVYAQRLGHDLAETTLFMTAVIAGGTVMQFPLGWLSDRVDRRTVLIGVFAMVAVVSGVMALTLDLELRLWLVMGALFGGTAFCVNALSVSHVNDVMVNEDRIAISAGLLLLFGAGAVIGPMLAGFTMAWFGAGGMFGQIAVVALFGCVFAIIRRKARPAPPDEQKEPFVAASRSASPGLVLGPRAPEEAEPPGTDGPASPKGDAGS
jgi:MFS family permease